MARAKELKACLEYACATRKNLTAAWQAYAGENTMSYFSQMVGLCAQNFLAGAAGLAVGIAFIRGLARHLSDSLGNFWVDLVRAILWMLLPASLIGALLPGLAGSADEFSPLHRS